MTKYIVSVASFCHNRLYPIRLVETVLVQTRFDGELGEKEATVRAISQTFQAKCLDREGMEGWTYAQLKETGLEDIRSHYWPIGVGVTIPIKLDDLNRRILT